MADPDRRTFGIAGGGDDRVEGLANLLLYGSPSARRRMAEDLAARSDRATWALLVATAASREDWRLRARCLEVLGLLAGSAGRDVAEELLALLFRPLPPAQT